MTEITVGQAEFLTGYSRDFLEEYFEDETIDADILFIHILQFLAEMEEYIRWREEKGIPITLETTVPNLLIQHVEWRETERPKKEGGLLVHLFAKILERNDDGTISFNPFVGPPDEE